MPSGKRWSILYHVCPQVKLLATPMGSVSNQNCCRGFRLGASRKGLNLGSLDSGEWENYPNSWSNKALSTLATIVAVFGDSHRIRRL